MIMMMMVMMMMMTTTMMMMMIVLFGLDGTPFLSPRKPFVSLPPVFGCVSQSKACETKEVFYCGGVLCGGTVEALFLQFNVKSLD